MFRGDAIANAHHFIKGGLVNEVSPLNSNVFKSIEGTTATAIFQGIPTVVNYGLELSVCQTEDQINAGVDAVDLQLRMIALADMIL
jgi:hypothetical protein